MTTNHLTVEDLFLADDLEAAGYEGVAADVRSSSHEWVNERRAGLLRVLGRYADAHRDEVDQTTLRDLELSDRLEALGCATLARLIRDSDSHSDVACQVIGWRELLERAGASPAALSQLTELITKAHEVNLDEDERESA